MDTMAVNDSLYTDSDVSDVRTDATVLDTVIDNQGEIQPQEVHIDDAPFQHAFTDLPTHSNIATAFEKLLNVGFANFNSEWLLVDFNTQVSEYLDIVPDKIKHGLSYERVINYLAKEGRLGPEDPELIANAMLQNMVLRRDKGLSDPVEFNMTTPQGRSVRITQIINPDNSLSVSIEEKTSELLQKETLETALHAAASGYWHYNLRTEQFTLESLFLTESLTQEQVKELTLEGLYKLIHRSDRKEVHVNWQHVITTGQSRKMTVRYITPDQKTVWLKFYLRPQFSQDGKIIGMICFFNDVSNVLRVQDELRKAKEDAEKSAQNIVDHYARMSHEIRTPMNAVTGITDALIQLHNDPAINPKLKLIEDSADSILRILDESLDHAKIRADKITLDNVKSDPRDIVRNICELWQTKALRNDVRLSCKMDETVPSEIFFDPYRYEQCLNNLISNAIKFSSGGNVSVILTRLHKQGHPPHLVLAVQDSGIGMSDDQQKRIFEAYTQADDTISRRFGGTGLGMTITQEIVKTMGGHISVKSKLGEGSVFAITLPIEGERQPAQQTLTTSTDLVSQMIDEEASERTSYENLRVLVVDDNATNHLVVNSLITTIVGEIFTANNGREALDILEIQDIDVVLMDIHMPVMDGIEATLAIRSSNQKWSSVPIVALTADPQYQQHRLCVNIGMDYALSKPVKLNAILTAFDAVTGENEHSISDIENV